MLLEEDDEVREIAKSSLLYYNLGVKDRGQKGRWIGSGRKARVAIEKQWTYDN